MATYLRRSLNSVGLDSTLGFVHDLSAPEGLLYDMQELWRTCVDPSVLECLEQLYRIRFSLFALNDEFQVKLSSEAARLVFQRVRANLSLAEIIENCRILARYMLREQKNLSFALNPITVKEKFENGEVENASLTKTAKQLGHNKSTHFYQKQRLLARGSIKLYGKSKEHFASLTQFGF